MELEKIFEKDLLGKGVIGQPDVPGLTAGEMQLKIEEIVRDVAIVKINEIIDWLSENGATIDDLKNLSIEAGAVTKVFGRRGEVVPQKGDYTAEMVGAAKETHAAEHFLNGKDPIAPSDIGAAEIKHTHGNITAEGKIGNTNGKILVTGIGGIIEAKEKEETGILAKPVLVATSGNISVAVQENREYEYTGVSSLVMEGSDVQCHGTVVFGDSVPSISVTGFAGTLGDDISEAKAGETWEFSCFGGKIIWINWGVI